MATIQSLLHSSGLQAFLDKAAILGAYYTPLSAEEFYRSLFLDGSRLQSRDASGDGKGALIALSLGDDGKTRRHMIRQENFSDLWSGRIDPTAFTFMSPIAYFGRNRTRKNAREMYALTIDIDDVTPELLESGLLYQMQEKIIPTPTYIINSGKGVHLYYQFNEPLKMYPAIQDELKKLKDGLTECCWNGYTSTRRNAKGQVEREYQSINQGFRIVGGVTKDLLQVNQTESIKELFDEMERLFRERGMDLNKSAEGYAIALEENYNVRLTVQAFKTGKTVDPEDLAEYVWNSEEIDFQNCGKYQPKYSLEEAKERFPDWYERRIEKGMAPRQWTTKEDLYYWWIQQIRKGATGGHRYWCLYCLTAYAIKAGIEYEQLEKDAYELMPWLNSIYEQPFTAEDVEAALALYNDPERAAKLKRESIERFSAIEVPANKRNYRPQAQHVKIMAATRDILYPDGSWRNEYGRPTKEGIVKDWRENNPGGTKAKCIRETGLSKATVYKWW